MPMKASGARPRLTSISTLVRPARRAAATTPSSACGVATGWRLTEMIKSPRRRPFSDASLDGSTAVTMTPREATGRPTAPAIGGGHGLQRQAQRGARCDRGFVGHRRDVFLAARLLGEFILARALADDRLDRLAAAVANDLERDARADRRIGDQIAHRLVGIHRLSRQRAG